MTSGTPPLPRERRRTTKGLRPLPQLTKDLAEQVRRLVAGELALFKAEMSAKAKSAGTGAGLLAGAVMFLVLAVGTLVTTAVLALALVFPAWLAALIVAAVLIVLAVVVGLIGRASLKKGLPPVPDDLKQELDADLKALKGERP
ncbi:MAG TPA: phage holin family protein [Leifsonia sp.]|jgi:Flp pilus assembly protein TadB